MARYSDHDEIRAGALQLRAEVRNGDPTELYDRLAAACRTDPERMAQLIMCLAIWVDPRASRRRLGELEAEAAAQVEPRPVLAVVSDPVEIVLHRDIRTATGVLPRGSRHTAAMVDGGWTVTVGGHQVFIEDSAVRGASQRRTALETAAEAHEEYSFAREVLGFGHVSALRWLLDSYRTTERQLIRWGFTNVRTEVAS